MAFPDALHFLQRPLASAAERLWSGQPAPMKAALLMLGATAGFACMGALIKLAAQDVDVLQVVFFRNFFAVLLFAPLLLRRGLSVLKTERLGLYGVRALIGLGAMTTGFAGVTLIPLAEATALNFTAPLFTTLLAVLILGERIRLHRTTALFVGFAGMLVILAPGFADGGVGVSLGAALALTSAALIAVSVLIVKRLTVTEPPEAIALWMVLMMAPASLIPALFVWTWPSPTTFLWLALLAAAGTLAHLCFTRACALGELSQIQPLEFVKLPISAAIGYAAFGEAPTFWVWLGGALIFVAAALITHREAALARRRLAAPLDDDEPVEAVKP